MHRLAMKILLLAMIAATVARCRGFMLLSYHEAAVCKGIPGGAPVRLWIAANR